MVIFTLLSCSWAINVGSTLLLNALRDGIKIPGENPATPSSDVLFPTDRRSRSLLAVAISLVTAVFLQVGRHLVVVEANRVIVWQLTPPVCHPGKDDERLKVIMCYVDVLSHCPTLCTSCKAKHFTGIS